MLTMLIAMNLSWAQEAVKLEVVHTVHAGTSHPALIVLPQVDADSLDVQVSCGTKVVVARGAASAGDRIRLEFPVGLGVHTCTGTLKGEFSDGTSGEMPLSFQVQVQPGLQLKATRADLDLEQHTVTIHPDAQLAQVDLRVFAAQGQIGAGTLPVTPPSAEPVTVQWSQSDGEVVRIEVTGTGPSGLSTTLNLFPWSFSVPHEDVVFPTDSAEVLPSEEKKLADALTRIQTVLEQFATYTAGLSVPVSLYVGGYTDTVGSSASNESLSRRRARSIGRWFRAHGLDRPIFYQGFGERSLAVLTGDSVDNPANRRAIYVVAAEAPAESDLMPGSVWVILN